MPFFTSGPQIRRNKFLEDLPATRWEGAVASFQSAEELNPVSLLSSYYQQESLRDPNDQPAIQSRRNRNARRRPKMTSNNMMSQEEAQQLAIDEGYPDIEIPADGMTELHFRFLQDRKRAQRERQTILARAPQDFAQGAVNIAAGVAASVIDPLNVASAFIPAVAATRWAGAFVRANAGVAGRGLNLGETAVMARHARFGTLPANATTGQKLLTAGKVGVAEGAVGAAVIEPLVFGLANELQDDYTLADSMFNIAFGAVLGGALHIGGTAITGRVAGVPERAELFRTKQPTTRVTPTEPRKRGEEYGPLLDADTSIETREATFRSAYSQTLEGRPVDVEDILRLEKDITANQRATDIEAQRARFIREKRAELDATVTSLKAKLRPGQAIDDAALGQRALAVEKRIKEIDQTPALPALAKERARLAQEFNDIRDLRISIKQMESIQAEGPLPKSVRDEMDSVVEERMQEALSVTELNQRVIDKITAMDEKSRRPAITDEDFKVMQEEAQRIRDMDLERPIDPEARKSEADEELQALNEDAEAAGFPVNTAELTQVDEAVARNGRVNEIAKNLVACRAA
jgi:hypothetical protein